MQEVAHTFMQVKVVVEKIQYLLSAFELRTCNMGFVWLAAEHSTVLQGQMKNISRENLNTDPGDLLGGPGQVIKTDGGRMRWKCIAGNFDRTLIAAKT